MAAPRSEVEDDIPNIPLLDDAIDHPDVEGKPTWRGWIHAVTAPLAVAAGIVLIVVANGAAAKASAAIFMASSILLFGVSAVYHRFNWSPRVKAVFRRLDHANIFILIAGTYTPLAINALPFGKGVVLLIAVWAGALLGIVFRVFWVHAPRWSYVPLYIGLGWAAVLYAVDLVQFNAVAMLFVLIGGLSYTAGALFYGFKRPNPWPGRFGFHELFHTCTVIAFLCHWLAILLIVREPLGW
ncbi:hemolysin III family protein [Pseudolysinimonas sp.]|uniref:PAQR family membrane homeostasis protein TrhA n=1 Tax=Pseudolysinimonas sp. TaxID=2680009 RepID=UPI00286AC183|nr:hemolysin III family protein [Pseudolysinimonas sp.]